MIKILTLAGSVRTGSKNRFLARGFADIAATQGAQSRFLDLADYDLPLYNDDLDKAAIAQIYAPISDAFLDHDVVFIASPEYNSSVTPLLKNTIDWMSQTKNDQFSQPRFVLGAASPGKLSGVRGTGHLRDILVGNGAHVWPRMVLVGSSGAAFDENGQITDDMTHKAIVTLVQNLIATIAC